MVHLIRHLFDFVSREDRKAVVPTLRVMKALEDFEAGDWAGGTQRLFRAGCDWQRVAPFFVYPSVRSIHLHDGCVSKCPRRVGAISK
ncbi:hypothetical protein [Mesorhizobium sp. RIZ17]